MKNSLLILLAGCSLSVFSQTSITLANASASTPLSANDIIYVTTAASSNTQVIIDVKNTSNSTKSYNAKRYDMLLNATSNATASAYFCFGGTCYGDQTFVS